MDSSCVRGVLIIIMYIYHALINALSAHIIHTLTPNESLTAPSVRALTAAELQTRTLSKSSFYFTTRTETAVSAYACTHHVCKRIFLHSSQRGISVSLWRQSFL